MEISSDRENLTRKAVLTSCSLANRVSEGLSGMKAIKKKSQRQETLLHSMLTYPAPVTVNHRTGLRMLLDAILKDTHEKCQSSKTHNTQTEQTILYATATFKSCNTMTCPRIPQCPSCVLFQTIDSPGSLHALNKEQDIESVRLPNSVNSPVSKQLFHSMDTNKTNIKILRRRRLHLDQFLLWGLQT